MITDIESCITKPQNSDVNSSKVFKYNEKGEVDPEIKETNCCAEKYVSKDRSIYKVKIDRQKEFYNPLVNQVGYSISARDKMLNNPMFKFREVSEKCFGLYIRFLKERQESLYLAARREI